MSRQRMEHPDLVRRRKIGRQIDKLASERGYTSANNRGRRIMKLKGMKNNPYNIMELEFMLDILIGFIK